MARATQTELIALINNAIQENTAGNITATALNTLLTSLTNGLYLPEVDTITVNAVSGVSTVTFSGGVTVTVDTETGEASVVLPDAPRQDIFGDINITSNEANTVTIGAGQVTTSDALLPITYGTTYFKIPGYSSGTSRGLPYDAAVGGFRCTIAGTYKFDGWASVRHDQNGATVGIVFGIFRSGSILSTSPRPTPAKMPNGGDLGLISGGGLAALEVDDVIVPLIGSNTAGTIIINNSTLIGLLVGLPTT